MSLAPVPVAEPAVDPVDVVGGADEPSCVCLVLPPSFQMRSDDGDVLVSPQGLDEKETDAVSRNEILFTDRSSPRYLANLLDATLKLTVDNNELNLADLKALVYTVSLGRHALFCPGAEYTRIKGVKFDVETGDSAPISQQPYRRSPQEGELLEYHIQQNMSLGVLRPYSGSWSTPAFVVKQKGKPYGRLVCDYRRVNLATRRLRFPMPPLNDLLRKVSGSRWYSGFDAASGFNHLALTDRAVEKLAIVTATGTYAWTVLPFGPINGPQSFQLVMSKLFSERSGHVSIYIDDVAVYS
jgi:hypothetical protein